MKFLKWTILPAILFFILTGCPYESQYPITAADKKINPELLGKWIKTDNMEKDKPDYFQINQLTDQMYEILEYKMGYDSTYTQTSYIAHVSEVGETSFLNMKRDGKYYLYKLEMGNASSSFTIYEVTDNIDETFNSSEELQKFVAKYKDLSFFYNKDEHVYLKQ